MYLERPQSADSGHPLSPQLQSAKMMLREKELRIIELDRQLEDHQLSVKLLQIHRPADMMVMPQHNKFIKNVRAVV